MQTQSTILTFWKYPYQSLDAFKRVTEKWIFKIVIHDIDEFLLRYGPFLLKNSDFVYTVIIF